MTEREYPHFVYAKMWEAIQPIARGERYEDPLEAALGPGGLGEVSGWITLPDEVYERFSTDELADQIEAAIAFDSSAEIRGSWRVREKRRSISTPTTLRSCRGQSSQWY